MSLFGQSDVPVILQQEQSECGLACVAMVACSFGHHINLQYLRAKAPNFQQGTHLMDLLQVAEHAGLDARPLRVSVDELSRLSLPAVLHWSMNHFVVLTHVSRKVIRIIDPASGRRQVSHSELNESFTGVALSFSRISSFQSDVMPEELTLSAILASFRGVKKYLLSLVLLAVVVQMLSLAPAIAMQLLIDNVLLVQSREWLLPALLGLSFLLLAGIVLEVLYQWMALYAGSRLSLDYLRTVVGHLFRLPADFVDNRHAGDLMSKLNSLQPVRQLLTHDLVQLTVQFTVIALVLVIMFFYSVLLTVISIVSLLFSLLIILLTQRPVRRYTREVLVNQATQDTSLLETISGFSAVKALGLSKLRHLQWQAAFKKTTCALFNLGKVQIGRSTLQRSSSATEQVVFLGIGISSVLEHQITIGVLFAFMTLRARLVAAVSSVMAVLERFFLINIHLQRLSDIVLASPQAASPVGSINRSIRGELCVKNLSFSYNSRRQLLLNQNFTIEAGSHAVIVGPSASGKTSLLKIMSGLMAGYKGEVLLDGSEIALWDQQALRSRLSVVLQNDKLFSGSIVENISAFSIVPDRERMCTVLNQVQLWSAIDALPMGMDTLIDDAANQFSGGQRQRLLLARALYRQPELLFMDEATSHLDPDCERKVLQAIADLGITVVSIAHRPQVLEFADKIISLEDETVAV